MPLYDEVTTAVAGGTFPRPDPVVIEEVTRSCSLSYITYVDLVVVGPILDRLDSKTIWAKVRYAMRNVPVQGSTILWEAWWKKNPRQDTHTRMWRALDLMPTQCPNFEETPSC